MLKRLFMTKPVGLLLEESEEEGHRLKKALGAWDLIAIGIGCIIGTGIFVLTGQVAVSYAGPGIILSFVVCAVACILAALCYAEFASLIPIAGSAYTFSYASLGELLAWIIGWDLILEYGVAASAVANGWSSHFVNFLKLVFGVSWPDRLALTPFEKVPNSEIHGILNVPAIVIVLLISYLLIAGIKESAKFNNIIVLIKVSISIFFIGVGLFFVNPSNWSPIVPKFVEKQAAISTPAQGTPETEAAAAPAPKSPLGNVSAWLVKMEKVELWKLILSTFGVAIKEGFGGWAGIFLGAAIIFFAYIGFDAVSTTSEEAKNPAKDLPLGIIGSLLICTVLYILMSGVFTGIVKCDGTLKIDDLGVDKGAPMVYAFKQVQQPLVKRFAALLVDLGGLCGITSVLLVTLLGQSRIFFAMSRDGLLPGWVAKVHEKFRTPYIGTAITGILVAIIAGIVPLPKIAEMANIGTLFAFVLVSAGIIFLRKHQPEKIAAFRTPLVPLVPILSIVSCLALMVSLPVATWIRFVVWLVAGLIIYFLYGINASKILVQRSKAESQAVLSGKTISSDGQSTPSDEKEPLKR